MPIKNFQINISLIGNLNNYFKIIYKSTNNQKYTGGIVKSFFNKLLFTYMMLWLGLNPFQAEALTTKADKIIDEQGKVVELKGVNWFGFNNQSTMVDGLWGNEAIKDDFQTVVYRMQLLGINAVRLPFSFKDLYELSPRNYSKDCPPATQAEIQANVTNPDFPVESGKTIPPMTAPAQGTTCNGYLPNDTTFNRFVWVVDFFAQNGFYVLIDNHLREDQTALEDKNLWVQRWTELAQAISQNPASKDRVMIDILNEPDNYGVRWEPSGDKLALGEYYLSAMDAIYTINPNLLFFVEGTGQGGIDANWGDGFATDPALISQYGLSDPNPFFKELVKKPYANQVVISPHIYPPSVTYANKNYSGAGLANRLTSSFGYLTQQGYCSESICKTFPIAVGEFGSRFSEEKDIESLNDLAKYFNNTGELADGKHQPITNWFYWSWNPNSGDTGGLVEDNWKDIVWKKINYLVTIGLTPWYFDPVEGEPGNDPSNDPAENPGTPPVENPKPEEQPPVEEPKPEEIPAPTPDEGKGEEEPAPAPSEVIDGSVAVKFEVGTSWEEKPGVYQNVVNLFVTNNGSEAISAPWTIEISNGSYLEVVNFWNMEVNSTSGGTIQGKTTESWQQLSPNGGNSVNIGYIVSSSSKDFVPKSVKINGSSAGTQGVNIG
ncbi:MAG: cellulase family glycosylhydrolase [Parachlamydiaceae bacterium]|nr:cellulase family glycosylhydrolase [Parachlamydiaceae bacterium]